MSYYAYHVENLGPYVVDPMAYTGLALMIARRYHCPHLNREDIEQEALTSLCTAARTYNPEKGTFATWAGKLIEYHLNGVVKLYRRVGNMGNRNVHVPKGLRKHLATEGGVEPEAVRPLLGSRWGPISDWDCYVAVQMASELEVSLDQIVGDTRGTAPSAASPLIDHVEDVESFDRMTEEIRAEDYQKLISEALDRMNPREREIATRRTLKMLDDPETLQDIGNDWGVSRERVRQIELNVRDILIQKLGREMRP